ncbi:MAG: hypothetical protein IT457_16710 [Planctomycetes bacterium]|nr:hypothetical protein [Planctomycetota bacterium]
MFRSAPLLSALAVVLPASAQSYVVSPPQAATTEGGTWFAEPFTGPCRYQQINADLRGGPRNFSAIAFRRDGIAPTDPSLNARLLDLEVSCATGSYSGSGSNFAANYLSAPTTVFVRKLLSLPDLSAQPHSLPADWSINLAFDFNHTYVGNADFLCELKVWAASSSNGYLVDGVSARDTVLTGGFRSIGSGCLTANGAMTVRGVIATDAANARSSFDWGIARGPSSAAAGLLIGLTDPNVVVPGLCPSSAGNRLHCDGVLASVLGSLDAVGTWTLPTVVAPWQPAFVGSTVTAQAAAVDPGQGGLGIAVSQGIVSVVPPGPVAPQVARIVATGPGAFGAASGTRWFGLGFVMRVRY